MPIDIFNPPGTKPERLSLTRHPRKHLRCALYALAALRYLHTAHDLQMNSHPTSILLQLLYIFSMHTTDSSFTNDEKELENACYINIVVSLFFTYRFIKHTRHPIFIFGIWTVNKSIAQNMIVNTTITTHSIG